MRRILAWLARLRRPTRAEYVTQVIRGRHVYLFFYDDPDELIWTAQEFAERDDLNFTDDDLYAVWRKIEDQKCRGR